MTRSRSVLLLRSIVIATILGSIVGCSPNRGSSAYVGRWECSAGGGDFFEIKANNGAFLLTDETGATYPASLDNQGILVVTGVPLMGPLPLPIDADTRELISSASSCKRFKKVQ